MTRYVYKTTITVTVEMADEGEEWEGGESAHWDSPTAQEKSAHEWAESAMPMTTYEEDFVTIEIPPLKLVRGTE